MSLQRLAQQGWPVPTAFVITADAYREHAARAEIRAALAAARATDVTHRPRWLATARAAIINAPLAATLVEHIDAAVHTLGNGPLAVRSSATAEDSAAHSFAGQHDTLLGITGSVACQRAVLRCWASLWTERAMLYRERNGLDPAAAAMAVVLQRCVAAEVAGVMFTCDPVSGDNDRVVIEAVYGLGESLVSGHVTPERVVLDKATAAIFERSNGRQSIALVLDGNGGTCETAVTAERAGAVCLADALARQLAELASRVEAVFGAAQDIEWAVADGQIMLLQARPVTSAAPASVHASSDTASAACRTLVWANTNTGELLPDVATPMTFDLIQHYVETLIRPAFHALALDVDDLPIIGVVAGRIYFCMTTMVAMVHRFAGVTEDSIVDLFGGDRQQLAATLPALAADSLPNVSVHPWQTVLRLPAALIWLLRGRNVRAEPLLARARARTKDLSDLDLAALSDDALVTHIPRLVDDMFAADGLADLIVGIGCSGYLSALCRSWFADTDGSMANRLLSGVGGLDSAEAGLELWRLGDAARVAAVADVLARAESFAAARIALETHSDGRAWLTHWDGFMAQHGHHTRGELDVAIPRWREEPDYVLNLVRGYLDAPSGRSLPEWHRERAAERTTLTAQAERRLRNPLRRGFFRWVLARAQRGVMLRETVKSEVVRRVAMARAMLLELGQRLVVRGVFGVRDDVFFVTLNDLAPIVHRQSAFDVRTRVALHRTELAEHQQVTPPPVVVGRFDPRCSVSSPEPVTAGNGAVLHGIAVSPGVVTGSARVILRADAGERVLPGEILIAPFTDPGWTPYFLPAAGIVVDLGGVLSHGSIVAREYGIPAVVNVGNGTRTIRTGQLVRVDGFRGEVTLVEEAKVI